MDSDRLARGAENCDSLPENRLFPNKLTRVNTPTHRWSPWSYDRMSQQHTHLTSSRGCYRLGLR